MNHFASPPAGWENIDWQLFRLNHCLALLAGLTTHDFMVLTYELSR